MDFFSSASYTGGGESGRQPAEPIRLEEPQQPQRPADPNQPSSWAADEVASAIAAGLVPQHLQGSYSQTIVRAEFCELAEALYERVTGREVTQRVTFTDTASESVEKMAALGVVLGTGDGTFDPGGLLTREQAATMLVRLAAAAGRPRPQAEPDFTAAGAISSWAREAVGQVQESGIMNGVGEGRFAPGERYSREQSILTMYHLYQLLTTG